MKSPQPQDDVQGKAKHGPSRLNPAYSRKSHPVYACWKLMLRRCYDQRAIKYHLYGARGITVCDEWRTDFDQFFRDMGDKPGPEYSIDRIDPDKGYSPENCRWATWTEQARNRRCTVKVMFRGQERVLAELRDEYVPHLPHQTVNSRVKTYKWSIEQALGLEPRKFTTRRGRQ